MKENMLKLGTGIILITASLFGGHGPSSFEEFEDISKVTNEIGSKNDENMSTDVTKDFSNIDKCEIDFENNFFIEGPSCSFKID